jgi:uroporphyrinogen III methyltransferase/synthase
MNSQVFLVGGGPGDPGLITLKGVECIKRADVIIYDFLASPELLKHASEEAEIIYVGKQGGDHTLSQEKINRLIVEKAKAGLIVTRLKGGDPFIFGRGGEEVEVLLDEGVPFEIVPGVTSAIAAPAYAGIPLTHRDYTSTLAFITGHEDPTKEKSRIDWESLAKGIGTLVFLMGVKNLPRITAKLLEHGMPPEKPVALIRWGSTPRQVTVTGTLATIVNEAEKAGMKPPAIIVVGDIVQLRQKMKWFENRPLMGKRIIVTRARQQASDVIKKLFKLGADCIECPTIRVVPPDDYQPLDDAIEKLPEYDWIVFTSVNGVQFFFERLFEKNRDTRALSGLRTAVIGPATAKRLLDFGLRSDIVPASFIAEAVIEAFEGEAINGKKILLPRADQARQILPQELSKMGALVDEVVAYRTVQDLSQTERLMSHLEDRKVDILTFTSSSTVKNFKAMLPPERFHHLLQGITVAAIGPITADTARSLGFEVHITAGKHTIPGLCEAIVEYFQNI